MSEAKQNSSVTEIWQGSVCVSMRSIAALCLLLVAAAFGCRFLNAEQAQTAALKVVLPALAVGFVPGVLITMLWAPRPQLTVLEVLGFGAAFSFGLVHLVTILAVMAHLSPVFVLAVMTIASAIAAGRILQRSRGSIVASVDEAIVLTLMIGLGSVLFLLGSPVETMEDQVHVAITRRLSQLASPSLDNVYFAPGIVYTYPFPGTHYYMALIARAGDIDALFLYQKLRFFWGPAALLMLHLMARAVFGAHAVACAVTSTAVMLVCTGVFATIPGLMWGQLVPFSHATDVAMTVLLPAMLMTAFNYVRGGARRERAFFLTATSLLAVMLTSVHIREVVQFCVYLGCFVAVSLVLAGLRQYTRRAMLLLGLVVTVAAIYTVWHAQVAPFVAGIVDGQRTRLASRFAARSIPELLFGPLPDSPLSDFVPYFELVWAGLTPFFLFAGPTVILLFRHQPLVWLLSASTLMYLAVMSIPLLAFSYVYLTYFEILFTPVRNVIIFVYLFAGAFLYAIATGLTRIDRTKLSPLVVGAVVGIFALLATLNVNRTAPGFFAPLLLAYGLTFLLEWSRPVMTTVNVRTIGIAIVSLFALVALWPDHAPEPRTEVVNVRWTTGLADPRRETLEREFGLTNGMPTPERSEEVNAWSYRLHDLSRVNVEALVTHPDVVDTHYIDRATFTVPPHSSASNSPFLGVQHATWLQYPGWTLLIGTVLLVWMLGFLIPSVLAASPGDKVGSELMEAFRAPFYKHLLPFALCLAPFALWSTQTTLSPVRAALVTPDMKRTPKEMYEQMSCVTLADAVVPLSETILPEMPLVLPERVACPPDYAVVEWVKHHVPVDAVFAVNRWSPYLSSVFMPQQVVVSPNFGLINEYELFAGYYRFYRERLRKYRAQPFFNDVETPLERAAFVKELGVTHVLVDPEYHDRMRPVLDGLSEQFELQYSGGNWAIYAVAHPTRDQRDGV